MIRQGNGAFTITLPKAWVVNIGLKPKDDLYLTEHDRDLIISPDKPETTSLDEIIIGHHSEEEIASKIISIYRQGHNFIRFSFRPEVIHTIEHIASFLNKFHGIVVKVHSDSIVIHDEGEHDKCFNIIKKCFKKIVFMSTHLNMSDKDYQWKKEMEAVYENVFFKAEYAIRIINKFGNKDFNQALRDYSIVSICQNLAEIVKSIAEYEYCASSKFFIEKRSYYLSNVLNIVHNVCYRSQPPEDFYMMCEEIETDIIGNRANTPLWEHAVMLQFLCKKMVMETVGL